MTFCSCKTIMGLRLLGNAAIEQYGIKIKSRVLLLRIDWWDQSTLCHVHITQGMSIHSTVSKRPLGMPRTFSCVFKKITVKRDILTHERALWSFKRPGNEFAYQVRLPFLSGVSSLFASKTIDGQGPILYFCPLPGSTLQIELTTRIGQIDYPYAQNRVQMSFCATGFYIYGYHD